MATVSKKQKKVTQKPPKSRSEATSALSQPVVAGSASLAALSSFSPDGHSFALLSLAVDKHRLRVFDVANGNVTGEYVLQVSSGTCLQWAKISNIDGGRATSPSKKRKRTTQESEPNPSNTSISVIMLGLANGTLTFFSPARGTTVLSLAHSMSTTAILSASMDFDEGRVWTSSADGSIHLWDIHSNTILGSWKSANRTAYSNICLKLPSETQINESPQILAANHSVDLLEASQENSTPETVAHFSGHVTKITSMMWIPSSQQLRFITSAERDRFVQGWAVPSSGSDGKLDFSASVDGDVRKLHTTPDGKLILVVSSTGTICLFAPPTGASATALKSLEPVSVIRFTTNKGKGLNEAYELLDATFASHSEGTIQVAQLADGAQPIFQSIRFTDQDQELIAKVNVKNTALQKIQPAGESSSRRYKESDGVNLGSGIVAPKAGSTNEADVEIDSGALDTEMAELSLGQRLRAMQHGEDGHLSPSDSDSDAHGTKKGKKGRSARIEVPTESLSRTLTQALHSSDAKLLEGCLRHSDPVLIRNTVMRIPAQLAVPLLQACVDRLARGRGGNTGKLRGSAASAQRGTAMIAWIKVVLVVHSGYLMTMPNLVSRLASLHATLTTRLSLQERLLLLNGRLDLALSQVELRSATAPTKIKYKHGIEKEKTVTHYVEGDSSDEQEMEVDVEEGSDEGDIEDIGLGGRSNQRSDSEDESSEEESGEEEELCSDDAEDDDDQDDDEDDSEDGPRLNGLIDDEAEESWGSEEGSEDEEDDE